MRHIVFSILFIFSISYLTKQTRKYILILFFIVPSFAFSQASFTEHIVDTSASIIGINKIIPVDFNLDGLLDVAVSKMGPNNILYYENMPNGGFAAGVMIDDSTNFAVDICTADFDGNGFPDLASFSLFNDSIYIHPSYNGTFGSKYAISAPTFSPSQLHAADLNVDGYPDLLAIDDTVVYAYYNDGVGNFTQQVVISETEYYSGNIADINGDSLPDILLGSVKLYTLLNNGDGTFTKDLRNDQLINDFIFQIELADIDQDGDIDMAVYYSNTNSHIDWYENDSTGEFTFAGSITTDANDVNSMRFADFTGNGYPDFVTVYGQTGELVWMENLGTGNFSLEIVLKTYPVLPRQVAVGDVDSDGDIDLFCSHITAGLFYWENNSINLGIVEAGKSPGFYPNPAKETIHLKCKDVGSYSILNSNGETVLSDQRLIPGNNTISLNLSPGFYIVAWQDGIYQFREPLVIME